MADVNKTGTPEEEARFEVRATGESVAPEASPTDTPVPPAEEPSSSKKSAADEGYSLLEILEGLALRNYDFKKDATTNAIQQTLGNVTRTLNVAKDGTVTVTANNKNETALTADIAKMIVEGILQKHQGMEVRQVGQNADFGLLLEAHRDWIIAKVEAEQGLTTAEDKAARTQALFAAHPFTFTAAVEAEVTNAGTLYEKSIQQAIERFTQPSEPGEIKAKVAGIDKDEVKVNPGAPVAEVNEATAKKIIRKLFAKAFPENGVKKTNGPTLAEDELGVTFPADALDKNRSLNFDSKKQEITVKKDDGLEYILTKEVADFLVKLAAELGWKTILIDQKLARQSEQNLEKALEAYNDLNPLAKIHYRIGGNALSQKKEGQTLTLGGELREGPSAKQIKEWQKDIDQGSEIWSAPKKLWKPVQKAKKTLYAALRMAELPPDRLQKKDGSLVAAGDIKFLDVTPETLNNKHEAALFEQFYNRVISTSVDADDEKYFQKIPGKHGEAVINVKDSSSHVQPERVLVAYYEEGGKKHYLGGATYTLGAHMGTKVADGMVGYIHSERAVEGTTEALFGEIGKKASAFYLAQSGATTGEDPAVFLTGEIQKTGKMTVGEMIHHTARGGILPSQWAASLGNMGAKILKLPAGGYRWASKKDPKQGRESEWKKESYDNYRLFALPWNDQAKKHMGGETLARGIVGNFLNTVYAYYSESPDVVGAIHKGMQPVIEAVRTGGEPIPVKPIKEDLPVKDWSVLRKAAEDLMAEGDPGKAAQIVAGQGSQRMRTARKSIVSSPTT